MRSVLLLPSLLACTDKPNDTAADAGWSRYTGWETQSVVGADEDDTCALYWDVQGASSAVSCPDCVFVFDLTFTLDPTRSDTGELCAEDVGSYGATYALQRDIYGEYTLGTWTYGEVIPFADATLDAETGRLSYTSAGALDTYDSYYNYYYSYYDDRAVVGEARLAR